MNCALKQKRKSIDFQRLRDKIVSSSAHGSDGRLHAPKCGDEHHGKVGPTIDNLPRKVDSAEARHVQIGHHNIELFALENIRRLERVGRPVDGKTSFAKTDFEQLAHAAIVLDDEIATGGSIIELLERLKDFGCTEAAVACTHGLFTGKAVERLSGHPMISQVVTTDTVPPPAVQWPALHVRSVAGLFAEAIGRIHAGESISSLFDGVDPTHAPPQPALFN